MSSEANRKLARRYAEELWSLPDVERVAAEIFPPGATHPGPQPMDWVEFIGAVRKKLQP